MPNSSTPVLSWSRVAGATSYQVQKGSYVIVFKNPAIMDRAGNTLVDKKVAAPSP